MKEFQTYHPIVNLIFFVLVIGFSCVFMHPICLAVSLICSFTYSIMLKGTKTVKRNLLYMLCVILVMVLINPVFNHEGVTILECLPNGNPLTLESVIYGFAAAMMILSVICWFSCYNEIMTSDKFLYLFGKIIPGLSLIISMTLRFVPKFLAQLTVVTDAQKCMGRDITTGSILQRAKHGLTILSIMTTWSLENAIETADSMKSRGYGHSGRTAFSNFTFDKRDKKAMVTIMFLGVYIFAGSLYGGAYFSYFPKMEGTGFSFVSLSVFVSYLLLCISPIVIEICEVRKWKLLRSKI